MIKKGIYIFIILSVFIFFYKSVAAQITPQQTDTFFLAKKKGLLGRFGQSISTTPPDEAPVKVVNLFLKYKGKVIRSIETVILGFEYNMNDTTELKKNIGVTIGKVFHKNTSDKVIKNNLFFKEGDRLYPYLLADNERYLRELSYTSDARILVDYAEGSKDSVDIVILTKDVFSIGGRLAINGKNQARAELRDENFLGSGNRLLISGYYQNPRSPKTGFGGEYIRRNIRGTFIDWVSGYQNYKQAFSSGRNQETVIYTRLEKPLVTPYIPSTGALEWSYQNTRNAYDTDSLYRAKINYAVYNIDAWFGYSLDSKRSIYANKEIRVHKFIAIRTFKQHFIETPLRYKDSFDYRFTNSTGILASLNIFKQIFYKTNFIYGFGRTEDVPEGFSAALTTGYATKQNDGYFIKENINRPYAGLDLLLGSFRNKGFYSSYTFKVGGYFYQKRFEDVDFLLDINHFTRLRKLSKSWFNRLFIYAGIAAQANPVLNTPLFLNSEFGLPYFSNGSLSSDLRATIKGEAVFFNTKKILGFRFAPFAFTDLILLKPAKLGLSDSDLFTAVGGGIRTRNENLVFGTIELRGYYFPRVNGDMKSWKVEVTSNIRFKYKSSFINRPGFIIAN